MAANAKKDTRRCKPAWQEVPPWLSLKPRTRAAPPGWTDLSEVDKRGTTSTAGSGCSHLRGKPNVASGTHPGCRDHGAEPSVGGRRWRQCGPIGAGSHTAETWLAPAGGGWSRWKVLSQGRPQGGPRGGVGGAPKGRAAKSTLPPRARHRSPARRGGTGGLATPTCKPRAGHTHLGPYRAGGQGGADWEGTGAPPLPCPSPRGSPLPRGQSLGHNSCSPTYALWPS